MPAVYLDLYLISYLPTWRTDDLARVIAARLDLRRPIIVEGVFVLDALADVERCVDFLVFVRGQGSHGLSASIRDYNSRRRPELKAQFVLEGFDV